MFNYPSLSLRCKSGGLPIPFPTHSGQTNPPPTSLQRHLFSQTEAKQWRSWVDWPSSSFWPSSSTIIIIIITSPFGLNHWAIPSTHLAIPQHNNTSNLGGASTSAPATAIKANINLVNSLPRNLSKGEKAQTQNHARATQPSHNNMYTNRISASLKAIDKAKAAADLKTEADSSISARQNQILISSAVDRTRKEIRLLEENSSKLDKLVDEWTTYVQDAGNADELAKYKLFFSTDTFSQQLDAAQDKLAELRDLEYTMNALAQTLLDAAERNERAEILRDHQSTMGSSSTTRPVTVPPNANPLPTLYQLPTLKIKPFAGDKRDWPAFDEAFKAAVDTKIGNKTEKLNILRSLLRGEAETLIAGLRLEDANYKVAKDLLEETYGDKDAYVRALQEEMFNLRRCTTLDDVVKFHLELTRISREMDAMGHDIEHPSITHLLEKKLNKPFLREMLLKKAENPKAWNTTKFLKCLHEKLRRESAIKEVMTEFGYEKQSHSMEKSTKVQSRGRDQIQTITEPNSQQLEQPESQQSAQQSYQRVPYACTFCEEKHWHHECQEYRTYSDRMEIVQLKNLCVKCLRANHQSNDCRRPATCYICKQQHPTALCRQEEEAWYEAEQTWDEDSESEQSHNEDSEQEQTYDDELIEVVQHTFDHSQQRDQPKDPNHQLDQPTTPEQQLDRRIMPEPETQTGLGSPTKVDMPKVHPSTTHHGLTHTGRHVNQLVNITHQHSFALCQQGEQDNTNWDQIYPKKLIDIVPQPTTIDKTHRGQLNGQPVDKHVNTTHRGQLNGQPVNTHVNTIHRGQQGQPVDIHVNKTHHGPSGQPVNSHADTTHRGQLNGQPVDTHVNTTHQGQRNTGQPVDEHVNTTHHGQHKGQTVNEHVNAKHRGQLNGQPVDTHVNTTHQGQRNTGQPVDEHVNTTHHGQHKGQTVNEHVNAKHRGQQGQPVDIQVNKTHHGPSSQPVDTHVNKTHQGHFNTGHPVNEHVNTTQHGQKQKDQHVDTTVGIETQQPNDTLEHGSPQHTSRGLGTSPTPPHPQHTSRGLGTSPTPPHPQHTSRGLGSSPTPPQNTMELGTTNQNDPNKGTGPTIQRRLNNKHTRCTPVTQLEKQMSRPETQTIRQFTESQEHGSPTQPENPKSHNTHEQHNNMRVLSMAVDNISFNPHDASKCTLTTIFLDNGAQRSLITSEMAKKLDLPISTTEMCLLEGFGDREPKQHITERVKLGLQTPGKQRIILSLNTIESSWNDMPCITLNDFEPEELIQSSLEIGTKYKPPDILLGMDIWHHLKVQNKMTLPSGFTISQTKLGPVISGIGQIQLSKQPKERQTSKPKSPRTKEATKPKPRKRPRKQKCRNKRHTRRRKTECRLHARQETRNRVPTPRFAYHPPFNPNSLKGDRSRGKSAPSRAEKSRKWEQIPNSQQREPKITPLKGGIRSIFTMANDEDPIYEGILQYDDANPVEEEHESTNEEDDEPDDMSYAHYLQQAREARKLETDELLPYEPSMFEIRLQMAAEYQWRMTMHRSFTQSSSEEDFVFPEQLRLTEKDKEAEHWEKFGPEAKHNKAQQIKIPRTTRQCNCACLKWRQLGKDITCNCSWMRKTFPCTCTPEHFAPQPFCQMCQPHEPPPLTDSDDDDYSEFSDIPQPCTHGNNAATSKTRQQPSSSQINHQACRKRQTATTTNVNEGQNSTNTQQPEHAFPAGLSRCD